MQLSCAGITTGKTDKKGKGMAVFPVYAAGPAENPIDKM